MCDFLDDATCGENNNPNTWVDIGISIDAGTVDAAGIRRYRYTTPVVPIDPISKTKFQARVKATSTMNLTTMKTSSNWWIEVNWQSQCSDAFLQAPDSSNIPTFSDNTIEWGVLGGEESITHFKEFENDICPEWCPDASNNSCGPGEYEVRCREQNETSDHVVPNITYGFTAGIDRS